MRLQRLKGDIFKIIVPLDDTYSQDYGNGSRPEDNYGTNGTNYGTDKNGSGTNGIKVSTNGIDFNMHDEKYPVSIVAESEISYGKNGFLSEKEKKILDMIKQNPHLTQSMIQQEAGIPLRSVKRMMAKLQQAGILTRNGNKRSGKWIVNKLYDSKRNDEE